MICAGVVARVLLVVVCLAVLVVSPALVIGYQDNLSGYEFCTGPTDTVASRSSYYSPECGAPRLGASEAATGGLAVRVLVDSADPTDWDATTTIELTVPSDSELAEQARHGGQSIDDLGLRTEAPQDFAEQLIGELFVGGPVRWATPTVTTAAEASVSRITVTGTSSSRGPAGSASPAIVSLNDSLHGTVEVAARGLTIGTTYMGGDTPVREDAHSVLVRDPSSFSTYLVADPYASLLDTDPSSEGLSQLAKAALSTLPWLAIVLVGRRVLPATAPKTRRLRAVATGLLCAHAAVQILVATSYSLAALPSLSSFEDPPDVVRALLDPAGFSGAVAALFVVGLLVLVPTGVMPSSGRRRALPRVALSMVSVLLVVATAGVAAVWLGLGYSAGPTAPSPLDARLARTVAVLLDAEGLVMLGAVVGAVLASWGVARCLQAPAGPFVLAGALLTPTALLGLAAGRAGLLPGALRIAVPTAAVVVAGASMLRLLQDVADRRPPARRSRGAATLVALLAAAVCAPWGVADWWQRWGWAYLQTAGLRLDALVAAALAVVSVAALRATGWRGPREPESLRGSRQAAIALAVPVFAIQYTFTPDAPIVALIAAGAGAFWVFPVGARVYEQRRARAGATARADAIAAVVEAGRTRRWARLASKKVEEKVADGAVGVARAREQLRTFAAEARPKPVLGLPARQVAFSGGTSEHPWVRGRQGALTGLVLGLPWTAAAVYAAAPQFPRSDSFPVLAVAAYVLPAALRWAAYGFLAGYFLPLVRGKTGFGKSVALFATSALPSVTEAVLAHFTVAGWQSTILALAQLAAFWTTLGLLSDRAVLLQHDRSARELIEVHNLSSLAAWSSSVVVAAGTAIATALVAGVTPFVTGLVAPVPATEPGAVPGVSASVPPGAGPR